MAIRSVRDLHLSIHSPIHLSILHPLSIHALSTHPYIHPFTIYLFIHLLIHHSLTHASILHCPSTHLSIQSSIFQTSICPFTHPFIHPPSCIHALIHPPSRYWILLSVTEQRKCHMCCCRYKREHKTRCGDEDGKQRKTWAS